MGFMRTLQDRSRKAAEKFRAVFRATLAGLVTETPVQLVQAKALAGETLQDVELFQQFGFTSGPPADTELIIIPLGGRTSHGVIVATEHGSFRVVVSQGETCVYNQWGAKITLKKQRLIHMECDDFVADVKNSWTVNATTIAQTATAQATHTAPALTFGGLGGKTATATMNANINQNGWHKSSGDQVAGGISQMSHTHPGDSGGTTGPPLN